jgi:hypothetical protein
MAFDYENLPKGGEEISFAGSKATVARIVKIAGGVEVTVQINDDDDETPVSGSYGGFNSADVEEWRKQADKDAEKNEKEAASDAKANAEENKAQAEKAQANKPSAVTKSTVK